MTSPEDMVSYTQLYLSIGVIEIEERKIRESAMPLNDLFQLCRERVTAEEAARYYGYVPDRRGKVLCPFHPDRHPSLSFHRGNFRCWSCGAAGSAIDFSARLFGLAPLDAVRKLNEDLGLDLPVDRAAGPEERERARREAELRETRKIFEEWRQTMLTRLCAAIRTGNVALRRPMEDWDPKECLAVREQARLEWYAATLEAGDREEQMEIFRRRKEVGRLCTRISGDTGDPAGTDGRNGPRRRSGAA